LTTDHERTRDVYEHIPGYAIPPSVPLPSPDDRSTLESLGVKPGGFSNAVTGLAMKLIGFDAFQRQLPDRIDDLLRTTNGRGPGLFAPVIVATLVMTDEPRQLDPLERAATLLFAARQLRDDVMAARLPQGQYKGQPLEMGQYPNFFGTSLIVDGRTPRVFKTDRLSQITVAVGGRFFLLDVGDLGSDTSIEQVVAGLRQVVEQARAHPLAGDENSPGILTSGTAKTQIRIFSKMQQVEPNASSLQALRHSFLTLCLDLDSKPADYAETGYLAHSGNPDNRWNNSSLQLVVFGNGKAAGICNFNAYLDGNVMIRGIAEIQRRGTEVPVPDPMPDPETPLPPARELAWQIPPEAAAQARKDLDWVRGDPDATFVIPDFGRDFCAKHGLAPVPTFIVALQMTAHRLLNRSTAIAQFLAMNKYCCMGLLTEVVSTPEIDRFVAYVAGDDVDATEAMRLLAEANESQARVARKKRRYLPLREEISLYFTTKKGLSKMWAMGVLGVTVGILKLFGKFEQHDVDIIASHPAIYPEVPILGRPGIRLPYAKEFGLHYQIMPESTTVVLMPSLKWSIPNEQLIAALQQSLQQIQQLAEQASQ